MKARRVGVLGGGPAGLYAARLLKLQDPQREVTVYERNPPGSTFGFGIALTGATQRNLAGADPESFDAVRAAGWLVDGMEMRVGGAAVTVRNVSPQLTIGRAALLQALAGTAASAGVEFAFGECEDVADIDADVVLACDGVNSAVRTSLQDELEVDVSVERGLYLWCGADFALPRSLFAPVVTEHGPFVTHAYPYCADRSTFLIETDEETWRRAGFDATTEATPVTESDEESIRYLEAAFAGVLDGRRLLGNRTRWLRFRTIRCRRWRHGRVVLLGDAAHTAHYSLGSGTKLAMEDAIALARCLGEHDEPGAAFAAYEALRAPAVERLQALARRSHRWWESFPQRTALALPRLAVAYMTRAGNVTLDRLNETNPDVVGSAMAAYAGGLLGDGDVEGWVESQPFVSDGVQLPTRVVGPAVPATVVPVGAHDPWGPDGDRALERVRQLAGAAGRVVRLTGPYDREAVLDRLDLAERLRLECGVSTIVEGPEEVRADLAAGLLSGRTDLIAYETGVCP
jgi:2-polyprenyl-6-methoxyphenol hydroxylase-like FAD-dependent oxidoreductase